MRVGMLFADRAGCGFYRCSLPANAAADANIGVDAVLVENLYVKQRSNDGEVVGVPPVDCDVLVLQRPMDRRIVDAIPFVQKQGVAVVVELDDDLERVPVGNAAYRAMLPSAQGYQNIRHLRRAVRTADLMTVSTAALARRYRAEIPVSVIHNVVPVRMLAQQIPDKSGQTRPVIGWTGMVGYHPYDLQEMGASIASLVRSGTALFRHVGHPHGIGAALGLGEGEWRSTGWVSYEQYTQYAAALDIGVVPLQNNQFNAAKSWLKGIEYAALGVPFVASPTDEYRLLHKKYGLGLLARTPSDWLRQLRRLVDNPDLRAELGARGKEVVAARLTEHNTVTAWADAWQAALNRRRAAHAVPVPA